MISDDSNASGWIPIDDSRGIWTEFRQVAFDDRQQQQQSQSHQQQRDESSPIHYRPEFDSVKAITTAMMTSITPRSFDSATMETKRSKIMETQSVFPTSAPATRLPPSSASTGYLRRNSSGSSIWKGIVGADEGLESSVIAENQEEAKPQSSHVESEPSNKGPIHRDSVPDLKKSPQAAQVVSPQGGGKTSVTVYSRRHSNSSGSLWTGIEVADNISVQEVQQVQDEKENQQGDSPHEIVPLFESPQRRMNPDRPQDVSASRNKQRGNVSSSPSPNPLQALTEIMSLDFLFGTTASKQATASKQDESLRETMGLRNNVNAEIASGLTVEDDAVVISSSIDTESHLARIGYTPGMQVVKVNGESCPKSLQQVYAKMQLCIQVIDDTTNVIKGAIIPVQEPKLDLYIHKETKRSKDMFITKVEPQSLLAKAGFQPGMRLLKVNGKCPTSFMSLAHLLTADIVAVPQDLAVPIGLESPISNLTTIEEGEEEKDLPVTKRERCSPAKSTKPNLLNRKPFRLGRSKIVAAR